MRNILAVTDYIFKQSFRNRILNVLILFAVFTIGFSLVISELAQEAEIKIVMDFGLFAIGLFAFLTLVLSVTVQMFEETELKTLMLIMVKPIKRHEYIIGKYMGIIATVFMNVLIMLCILMVIISLRGGDPWDIKLLAAAGYSFASVALLSSVALLLSVVTTSVPGCIIFLVFIYALGHLTIHLKNLTADSNNAVLKFCVDVVYYLVPNLELFNLKDKIFSTEALFAPGYLGFVAGYTLLYVAVILTVTSVIFKNKEFY
ncbi:MAG: ABC transporter permease subunit [Spirochaetia bacterium]|nr:ABC transporter permease subunit [Spirochaetia bacterium]